MNKMNKHSHMIFLIIIMALIFLVSVLINAYMTNNYKKESFTSTFTSMYRPHVRNARLFYEGFYNKTTNNLNNLMRTVGIK